jgi:PAS domain S-box-containing protein
VPADAVGDPELPDGWDPAVVTESPHGLVAADVTSRILAVSAEAATILGYDDPVELVGKRIVSIVPERYRQAHVAGLTMYLLVGRGPLLDRHVQLPALRRDGTEVEVELTVRSPEAGTGQLVLLADLRRARR